MRSKTEHPSPSGGLADAEPHIYISIYIYIIYNIYLNKYTHIYIYKSICIYIYLNT